MTYLTNTFLVGAVGIVLYVIQTKRSKTAVASQAYPHIDPLFGLDLKFQEVRQALKFQYLPFTTNLFKKYGRTFEVNNFGHPAIRTIEPENLQAAYSTNNKDWGYEPDRLPVMEPFCGRGFITTDGAIWKNSRTLLRPTFSKSNTSDLSHFQVLLNHLLQQLPTDGSVIDLQPLLSTLFHHNAITFLLGEPLSFDAFDSDRPLNDTRSFVEGFHNSMIGLELSFLMGPFAFLIPKSLKVKAWQQTHKYIDSRVDRALQKKKQGASNGNPGGLKEPSQISRSLLEGLVQQTDDRIEIRNQLLQGMLAGQDTTAILLSNTFFLLSRDPLTYERLRNEVLSIDLVSSEPDAPMTLSNDLSNVKLITNILKESLRLYPIFPAMTRVALNHTTLPRGGGEKGDSPMYIPRGLVLVSNFYTLHRDEAVFGAETEVFKPDRWNSIKPTPWEYMPFGGGPRACIGQHKALAEASYTVAKMSQTFRCLESGDDRDWAGLTKLTACNANGCKVVLIPA